MKKVWLECTYRKGYDHREKGDRAVGKAIWSPIANKAGGDIYKNMRKVSAGDVVLHLVDNKFIIGSSLVLDKKINIVEGIDGTRWSDPKNYLWNLGHFKNFQAPIIVKDFLNDTNKMYILDQIRETSEVFYTRGYQLRQGAYLTPVSKELLTLLNAEYSENHYESRIPHIHENLLYDSGKDLDVIIDKNFEKIAVKNKGKNYRSSHDESLNEIISNFKRFNFDYLSEKSINLKGKNTRSGDIDFAILTQNTLIIGEYKKGRNIEDEAINFNGKKNKYLKYLSENYEPTKNKFKNVIFLLVGELIDEKNLSKLERKLVDNGTIEKPGSYKYKNFNILGNRIIHRSQLDHYFDLSEDIHPDYAVKDFYKDFNIVPVEKSKMVVPAIKININHNGFETYDVYNFSCKASELIKFASVARRTPVKEELSSYQRLISATRITDIGTKFITEQQGFFPNNIVMKLEKSKISFSKKEFSSDNDFSGFESDFGVLSITEDYNTAWVIDGQHRLFSYFKADKTKNINDIVNVAAIVGVPAKKEVEYFIDINDKSKSVPKDLIWDLTGKIDPLSNNGIISNVCKELFGIDRAFSDRQLNPFYRKLSIPSLNDKGGKNFAVLCSIFKYECVGTDITKETYNKKMGDIILSDVKNPFIGSDKANMAVNIAKSISSFFHNLGKVVDADILKKFYKNNNLVFILVLIADRYFRYHNRMTIIKNDTFFDILGNFINNLTKDQMEAYKTAGNAQKRREVLGDIVYYLQVHYKEDFFSVVQSKLIKDVHEFCETKFPEFIYKKIKKDFGVDFVLKGPAFKKYASNYIADQNYQGNTNSKSWEGLNFYSDVIKSFLFNNNALKLGSSDNKDNFSSMMNDNGTINVWDNCFEEVFITKKSKTGYKTFDEFHNAIKRVKNYRNATTHTKKKSQQKKDNFDPFIRAAIKADFELLNKILDNNIKLL